MQGDRDKQLNSELERDAEASAEKLKKLREGAADGRTELPKAVAFIARACSVVQAEIDALKAIQTRGMGGKFKSWLRAIPSDVAAVLAIQECITACSQNNNAARIQELCVHLGQKYELEVRVRQAETVNPMYMRKIQDQFKERGTVDQRHIRKVYNTAIQRVMKGEIEYDLTRSDCLQIGKFGIDACVNAGIIEQTRANGRRGTSVVFGLVPDIREFLHNYTEDSVRSVVATEATHMICPPDIWTTLNDGGFLSTRRKAALPMMRLRSIRKSERNRLAEEFTAKNMPDVFGAGNYLQSIPFAMHEPTRAAVLRVWQSGGATLGVPRKNAPEKPECPFPPTWVKADAPQDELDVFQKWKIRCVQFYESLSQWRSKTREVGVFIRATAKTHKIWMPVFFDTRGRWYYRGVLNPQGSDMAKAVLHYAEKKPLGSTGLFWLKVHIANSFGFDKERFADRARWTEQNWSSIERVLDCPEDAPELFGDSPWCTFSAAWELREAYRSGNPETYQTGIICHMDATCSGLQHFSAMLRDPTGAQYVNLVDTNGCGPKQDIYAKVAGNALQAIKLDSGSTDPEIASMALWWLSGGIPRALAKKPVN